MQNLPIPPQSQKLPPRADGHGLKGRAGHCRAGQGEDGQLSTGQAGPGKSCCLRNAPRAWAKAGPPLREQHKSRPSASLPATLLLTPSPAFCAANKVSLQPLTTPSCSCHTAPLAPLSQHALPQPQQPSRLPTAPQQPPHCLALLQHRPSHPHGPALPQPPLCSALLFPALPGPLHTTPMACYDLCRPCGPAPLANSCNEPCVRQCQDSTVLIQPSPVRVTLPGPIMTSFPQSSAVGSTAGAALGTELNAQGQPISAAFGAFGYGLGYGRGFGYGLGGLGCYGTRGCDIC